MTVVSLVVIVGAGAVGLVRWLRVSQREHYLAGQVGRTAARWLTRRPPNKAVVAVWAAAVVVAFGSLLWGSGSDASAVIPGVVGATVGTAFPIGMTVVGKVRLRPTRRAVTQGVIAGVLIAAALVVVGVVAGVGPAAALAPAVTAAAVDGAAVIARPLERRRSDRYRATASAKLAQVQPRVIAITGSYGKTTVKNHVRTLLSGTFPTVASPASWNNQAGLSRTINEHLAPGTEILVAEMGTYGRGEIANLVSWLRPEIAVICAIGPVHLERFGSIEAIVEAKSEILEGARVAVLCVDDPSLDHLAGRGAAASSRPAVELWRVGTDPERDDLDVQVVYEDGSEASGGANGDTGSGRELIVRVRGRELARRPVADVHPRNVACAVAVALAAGTPERAVASALDALGPVSSRGEPVVSDGLTVLDDTFNSNPAGALAAVEKLRRLVPSGRRVVVTPGIVELGPLQDAANRDFAAAVDHAGDDLVVVGWTNRQALAAGHRRAVSVPDREAARLWVREHLAAGDGVLWENDLPDHYP